jgi:hypothetical protein
MRKIISVPTIALASFLLAVGNVLLAQDARPQSQSTPVPQPTPNQSAVSQVAQSAPNLYAPQFATTSGVQADEQIPQYTSPQLPARVDIRAEIKKREQKTSAALNSWIGADINDFIIKWGAPSGEYKMPNGNVIYAWRDERSIPAPVDLSAVGDSLVGMGGGSILVSCTISIFTSPRGNIFNWKWEGNGC